MAKYGKSAAKTVRSAMRRKKKGTLRGVAPLVKTDFFLG